MAQYHAVIPEDAKRTRSYRVSNLAYPALFGGVFALFIIGMKNARMLKLPSPGIVTLFTITFIFFIARILFYSISADWVETSSRLFLSILKSLDIALFFVYYFLLRVPFRLHMIFNEEYENMGYRGFAIYISIASVFIDFTLLWIITALTGA